MELIWIQKVREVRLVWTTKNGGYKLPTVQMCAGAGMLLKTQVKFNSELWSKHGSDTAEQFQAQMGARGTQRETLLKGSMSL